MNANPETLAAAAERLRRNDYPDRVDHSEEWDSYFLNMQKIDDMSLLAGWAAAYLDSHRGDDSTLIDESWLAAIGGEIEMNGQSVWFRAEFRYERFKLLIYQSDGAVLLLCGTDSIRLPANVTTRGQLRQLASALNIALKENSDG